MTILFLSCGGNEKTSDMNILFLHHSTGYNIWKGNTITLFSKIANRFSSRIGNLLSAKAKLPTLMESYNKKYDKNYLIKQVIFPKATPYGWNNYPFDYYNIWVKNAGEEPFKQEPTLEILTKEYQVIIFKHCFPVSNIQADEDSADINSDVKTLSNYKLQYEALREKLHNFPATKFILFTGAALTKATSTEEEARIAQEFFGWVKLEWDQPDDNIFLWDLYSLQTEGGLYFIDNYAVSPLDPHPNEEFAGKAVKLLFNRIIDVIENDGNGTLLTGIKI